MSIFKNLMDKLSGGSYSKLPETDLEKVIAERDALQREYDLLRAQFEQLFEVSNQVLSAKAELVDAMNRLAAENLLLRTALGSRASLIEVKN